MTDNLLPGVPLIESPLFQKTVDSGMLDVETLRVAREMHEKGYAIIDFPEDDLETLSEQIINNLHSLYDWEGWKEDKVSLRIQDAWKFESNVRRLAVNEAMIRLLSKIYGRQAWPFQTLNFPVGTQQHFHSDAVHFSSMPERFMCGVWVALEDVDLDQGPLLLYPGTHRWPIYMNEHIGHRHADRRDTTQQAYEPLWRSLVEAADISPKRVKIKKGQAVIWAANLLHGGEVHLNRNKTRWSQVTHYYFEGCLYYTPMNSDAIEGAIEFRSPINILTAPEGGTAKPAL